MKVKCSKCKEQYETKPYEIRNDELCPRCVETLFPKEKTTKVCDTSDNNNISDIQAPQHEQGKGYGGIGRYWYFLGTIGSSFGYFLHIYLTQEKPTVAFIAPIVWITAFVVNVALMIFRLKNIGRSGALVFFAFVPIVNLFVMIPCFMLPEGYEDTRKLDTTGKIIAGIIFVFAIFVVIKAF